MQARQSMHLIRAMVFAAAATALAGCVVEDGDGPDAIQNTAATPLPEIPEGFCDPINFEVLCDQPEIINFNGGATIVIDNPEQNGINTSDRVAQMQKFPDEPFGGTRLNVPGGPIDFSQGEFFRISVFADRAVPLTFKLEEEGNPGGGFERVLSHTGSGAWESLCYDLSDQAVPGSVFGITLIFDNGVLGQANTDPDNWTFLYDDIEQLESCGGAGGGGNVAIDPDNSLFSTSGNPSLTIPDDYEQVTAFGSGSVIDTNFVGDATFSPAVSVFSGTGYGANVAQIGLTGFRMGFLGAFETIDFKVKGVPAGGTGGSAKASQKGLPNQVLFVRLFDGVDSIRINLTSSTYAEPLGDDWFQVSIPLSIFDDLLLADGIVLESDDTSATPFRMLLADLGFSGVGDNPPPVAAPGIIPDDVIYTSDPNETVDLVFGTDYTEVSPFGSGSVFDGNVTTDEDFSPAFGVTTGDGYGAQVGQYALLGFAPGFAQAYEQLVFKAKGLNNDLIRVKLLDSDPYVDIDLTTSDFSTDLGNGWYQVVLPVAMLSNVETATGLLFETDNTAPESFTFLLTDFGFNLRSAADPGVIPDDVIYASDPDEMVDLVFGVDYSGFNPFGSGSTFDNNVTTDMDFSPAFGVTTGNGYGAQVGQFAIEGLAAGFAAQYESLVFKAKNLNNDLIRVKLLGVDPYLDINLMDSEFSTPLGNGWFQVVVPVTNFPNADTATDLLFETDNTAPESFTFLLTDFGFSGTAPVGELVTNGDFEADPVDKAPWINAGAVTVNNFYTAQANDGGNVFDTNLSQVTNIDPANMYVLSFRARASVARDIVVGIGLNGGSFTAETASASLTTNWQSFEFTLDAAGLGEMQDRRVLFDLGTVASTVDIDDVSLTVAGGDGTELLTNGDFQASAIDKAPWINAGDITTNNFYTVQANDGGNVFDTNLSQVTTIDPANMYLLTFRARANVVRDIVVGIGLNGGSFLAETRTASLTTDWRPFEFTLDAAALTEMQERRVLFDMGTVASTVDIDDVSLTIADGAGMGGGGGGMGGGAMGAELAQNGGLENGDFAGWMVFANGGTATVTNTDPSSGSFSANATVVAPASGAPAPPILKQESVGVGVVGTNEQITISFDLKGTVANGAFVNAEFFSERASGADMQLLESINAPNAGWTSYGPYTVTTSDDVTRGITVQFVVICGAVAGCMADVDIDNVSITQAAP